MIHTDNHISLQVFGAGLELDNLLNLIIELDEYLDEKLKFAFNEKYGFLTACPIEAGTAMKASVMVHLPALQITGNIGKVLEIINNFGMNVTGIHGEGSKSEGALYQISNKQTLGISEKEIIKKLKLITDKIIEQERIARKYLGKNRLNLEDRIYRNYGILTNCRKISETRHRQSPIPRLRRIRPSLKYRKAQSVQTACNCRQSERKSPNGRYI